MKKVMAMLKAIHAQEDREAAEKKAMDVVEKLKAMKLHKAAKAVETGVGETVSYMSYPREHWRRIRTNNSLERIMREIRRRTRVVGAFPDGKDAMTTAAAIDRLVHPSVIIELNVPSYRVETAKKTKTKSKSTSSTKGNKQT